MTARKHTEMTAGEQMAAPRSPKAPSYVKGSHAARVRTEHDAQRVELLALHDVLSAQRDGLSDQIEDIVDALQLLSAPATNVVALNAAAE